MSTRAARAFIILLLLPLLPAAAAGGQDPAPGRTGTGERAVLTLPDGTRPVQIGQPAAGPARLAPTETWTALYADGFEAGLGSWSIYSFGYADAYWGTWTCWSGASPTHSIGCATAGGEGIVCGGAYPDDMGTLIAYGPFSLADPNYIGAAVGLNFSLNCESGYDFFYVAASVDGANWYGDEFTGSLTPRAYTFDLTRVDELGSLLGQSQVWIGFYFESDGSLGFANGAQVDDVVIAVATAVANQVPQVTVTAPNGGESWAASSVQTITYTATDADGPNALSIALDYSTNGGGSWTPIAAGLSNTGSYPWTLPDIATSAARVRVRANDGADEGSDASDANFAITQVPAGNNTLALTSASGTSGGPVSVQLTLANENVVKGVQLDILYNPAIAGFGSVAAANRGTGMSASGHTVSAGRARVVLYFATAASIAPGTGAIADLSFDLTGSLNASTALTPADIILSDEAGHALNATGVAGSLTVTAVGNQAPQVTVTAPNGGESWAASSVQTITYTATDTDGPNALSIALDYSTNGGGSWTPIAAGLSNTGSYPWTLPGATTTTARVRVRAHDGADEGSDISNGNFAITRPQGVNVLAIASGAGAPGATLTVALSLANEDEVKGLQADLLYDEAVARPSGITAAARGSGLEREFNRIASGRGRIVLYSDDATTLAPGSGAIANIQFELVGQAGAGTDLTLTSLILSDPEGGALALSGQNGTLAIQAGGNAPAVQVVALKNPGRPRYLHIIVRVANGSGGAPAVSAGGVNVALSALATGIWDGYYSAAAGANTVIITAADTNASGTGTGQVTIAFD